MAYICYDVLVKRTTIFLPDTLHERLRSEAFQLRVSMAELIRMRLEPPQHKRRDSDPLTAVEGILESGSRQGLLSEGIDEALYGG